MEKNKDRIAIVTGASRLKGIGAAICRELADAGHPIFFTYYTGYDAAMPWGSKNEEPMLLKQELEKKGVQVGFIELDLTTLDASGHLLKQVNQELGMPSILINNACYSTSDNYMNITAEELDRHYLVNIRTTTMLSSYFARQFQTGKGGRIINLTSGQFQRPMPGELSYATTKGAIEAMTYTLAAEVGERGITVNAVNPGPTDTGWMTGGIKEGLAGMFPSGRVGEPLDAARLIKFLASEEGEWITGQTIHSEGGFAFGGVK
ncbi:SDR family oxidoreductase [Sutcliffiella rhizosphaerae]|uniref:3-oxoacyl-[acyl-carrier-protein] reductase FabG n=1 Tax=Sutcliffiella rhizosphaerae TaxID=2880967 RepID=A0ABM8YKI9_9BACI|nr:SDR family oxidoreductase [Sutcliffiella rhizosphaerae]CAG9620446.1 3-oxoacyl-[acyl-carrier-protein] reductase FabG [Sutcliffiella rhizosphaerae]